MAKKGTLVVRFIGDVKEFEQANKKMGTGLDKTGKAIDSSLTQPFGKAGTAATQMGKDFSDSQRKMSTALSGTKRDIDSNLTMPLDKVSTATKQLSGDFQTQTRKISSLLGGTRADVQQFERDVKDIKVKVGFDDDEAQSGMDGFFSDFKGKAATGGAIAGTVALAAFWDAIGSEADVDRVAAQLGLSKRQSAKLGRISGEIFANNWADSVGEAATGVGAALSSIPGLRAAGEKDIQRVSQKLLAFADLFEIDVSRAAQVAGQSIRTGFAKNADQAIDLLFKSTQKVPAAVHEDLLDALDEYGPFLQTLGFQGKEAFGLLVEASKKGMYGIDKAGDALKEFTIRGTDMSTTSKQAYKTIGLDAQRMSNLIVQGGEGAKVAFDQVITGLLKIDDPAKRANTAIKLFGTPIEDLNVSEIPKFLRSLRDGSKGLENFSGSANKAMDQMSDNVQSDFKTLMNGLRQGAQDTIGGLFSGDWSRVGDGLKRIFENLKTIAKKYWRQLLVIASFGLGLIVLAVIDHWDDIKRAFGNGWDKVKDIWNKGVDWIKTKTTGAMTAIRDIFTKGFGWFRDVVRAGWGKIWGVFTKFVRVVVDKMLDFAGWLLDAADKAFGWIPGIGDKLDAAKAAFADFREGVNRQIAGINPSKSIELKIIPDAQFENLVKSGAGHPAWTGNRALGGPLGPLGGKLGRRMAAGGAVTGGVAGKDSVHILGMPDEHMWTTEEVRKTGGHKGQYKLRAMAREGLLKPMAKGGPVERERGVIPRLAEPRKTLAETGAIFRNVNRLLDQLVMLGKQSAFFPAGRVGAALKWTRSQVGTPYLMGGVGPGAYDCSGFMSAITNYLRGRPLHSRVGSTATFPWSGFAQGADPKGFTIGSTPSYPGSSFGHMAGTLGGVNVESSGGVGVRVGPGARGYNDPGFSQVYHLVGIKGGRSVRGSDIGAPAKELMRRRFDTGGVLPPGGIAFNGGTRNEYVHPIRPRKRRIVMDGPVVIDIGGEQLRGVMRAVAREEVEDEMRYQAGF